MIEAFYVGPPDYKPGDVRAPGNWGRKILADGPDHIQYGREMLMEEIRSRHYASKPSRLRSNFLCYALEHAVWYRSRFVPQGVIYDVLYDAVNYPLHHGQLLSIPPVIGLSDTDAIHQYWVATMGVAEIGGPPDFFPWESLTYSPMEIVRARP